MSLDNPLSGLYSMFLYLTPPQIDMIVQRIREKNPKLMQDDVIVEAMDSLHTLNAEACKKKEDDERVQAQVLAQQREVEREAKRIQEEILAKKIEQEQIRQREQARQLELAKLQEQSKLQAQQRAEEQARIQAAENARIRAQQEEREKLKIEALERSRLQAQKQAEAEKLEKIQNPQLVSEPSRLTPGTNPRKEALLQEKKKLEESLLQASTRVDFSLSTLSQSTFSEQTAQEVCTVLFRTFFLRSDTCTIQKRFRRNHSPRTRIKKTTGPRTRITNCSLERADSRARKQNLQNHRINEGIFFNSSVF